MTQENLAALLAARGVALHPTTITRIERGSRRVNLDEALAVAAALGVSPVHLFAGTFTNTNVTMAPGVTLNPRQARQWMRGQQSLRPEDDRTYYSEVSDDEWVARQQAGLGLLLDLVQRLVDAVVDDDRDRAATILDDLNDELARQRRWAERHGGYSSAGRPPAVSADRDQDDDE